MNAEIQNSKEMKYFKARLTLMTRFINAMRSWWRKYLIFTVFNEDDFKTLTLKYSLIPTNKH